MPQQQSEPTSVPTCTAGEPLTARSRCRCAWPRRLKGGDPPRLQGRCLHSNAMAGRPRTRVSPRELVIACTCGWAWRGVCVDVWWRGVHRRVRGADAWDRGGLAGGTLEPLEGHAGDHDQRRRGRRQGGGCMCACVRVLVVLASVQSRRQRAAGCGNTHSVATSSTAPRGPAGGRPPSCPAGPHHRRAGMQRWPARPGQPRAAATRVD